MYPHDFDRYRMMGYIMRQIRQENELTQEKLGQLVAKRNTSKPSSTLQRRISHVENFKHLTKVAEQGHLPVAREIFIQVASEGLGLSQFDTDTLLWLIEYDDFRPLQKDELIGHPSFSSAQPRAYKEPELRANALALLEQAVRRGRFPIRTKVQMYTGWDEEHQVGFRRQLHLMEKQPGQRLLISKYPSYLLYQGNFVEYFHPSGTKLSDKAFKETERLNNSRKQRFKEIARNYGERCIHSVESLTRYLDKAFVHSLPWKERRAHVQSLIDNLEEFDRFEVALASTEPEMEFVIKSGQMASLRGTARDINRRNSVICGPLYIFWDNFTAVYSFMVDFENAWNRIPLEQREKKKVIAKLQSLLGGKPAGVVKKPAQKRP